MGVVERWLNGGGCWWVMGGWWVLVGDGWLVGGQKLGGVGAWLGVGGGGERGVKWLILVLCVVAVGRRPRALCQ